MDKQIISFFVPSVREVNNTDGLQKYYKKKNITEIDYPHAKTIKVDSSDLSLWNTTVYSMRSDACEELHLARFGNLATLNFPSAKCVYLQDCLNLHTLNFGPKILRGLYLKRCVTRSLMIDLSSFVNLGRVIIDTCSNIERIVLPETFDKNNIYIFNHANSIELWFG